MRKIHMSYRAFQCIYTVISDEISHRRWRCWKGLRMLYVMDVVGWPFQNSDTLGVIQAAGLIPVTMTWTGESWGDFGDVVLIRGFTRKTKCQTQTA